MNIKSTIQSTALSLTLLGTAFFYTPHSFAGEAEDRGLEIAQEQEARNTGFRDSIVDLDMILTNEAGDKAQRTLTIKTLEVNGDGDKTITLFNSPRDVKGTSLLTWSHSLREDEQWLYLPALKRVKRISSKNKSGSFMGSEFSYEDLSSQEVDKYTYRYLRDETYEGVDCFVSEQYPTYKHSGYTKQVAWIDKSTYNNLKVEFYDRGNALLKTLYLTDYKQYHSKFWRAQKMNMVNHLTGKETELSWGLYKFSNNLNSSVFTKNRLATRR